MLAKALIIPLTLAALVSVAADAHAQAKTIRMPTASGSERIFAILLPPSYDTSKARYPVVYLFHGGGQDHTAFMARTAFPPMARKHEFIVVMPAADRGYSALGPEAQGRYHDYVARELVDYVDANYRTLPSRDQRAIGGLSMGGRIATMSALRHADREDAGRRARHLVLPALSAARSKRRRSRSRQVERKLPYAARSSSAPARSRRQSSV